MVDDFQATVGIGLILISFFSVVWALVESAKRKDIEAKLRKAKKELHKYKLEEYYKNERQAYSKMFIATEMNKQDKT